MENTATILALNSSLVERDQIYSLADAMPMNPVQYAVTFSLLPTTSSSIQKNGLCPVAIFPIAANPRYKAAAAMVPKRWLGTGYDSIQISGYCDHSKELCAYLLSSHAVQKQGLDDRQNCRKEIEIQQTEGLKPAFGHDVLEGGVFAVSIV